MSLSSDLFSTSKSFTSTFLQTHRPSVKDGHCRPSSMWLMSEYVIHLASYLPASDTFVFVSFIIHSDYSVVELSEKEKNVLSDVREDTR